MKGQPDGAKREYGALLIMDTSVFGHPTFRQTPLARGMTWAEAQQQGLDAPQTTYPKPTLGLYEYIIGEDHSHPSFGDPDTDLRNQAPSGKDWNVYNTLTNIFDSQVAPPYAFSHYIVGADGKQREYKQDKKTRSPSNDINGGC